MGYPRRMEDRGRGGKESSRRTATGRDAGAALVPVQWSVHKPVVNWSDLIAWPHMSYECRSDKPHTRNGGLNKRTGGVGVGGGRRSASLLIKLQL